MNVAHVLMSSRYVHSHGPGDVDGTSVQKKQWLHMGFTGFPNVFQRISHRKNAGTLQMVPLIVNPKYTLYYMVGIYWVYPLLKGSLGD